MLFLAVFALSSNEALPSFPAQLIGALESKVKHAQCFDVALMRDGSIVLASKDYRLYIYRYVKVKNGFYSRII